MSFSNSFSSARLGSASVQTVLCAKCVRVNVVAVAVAVVVVVVVVVVVSARHNKNSNFIEIFFTYFNDMQTKSGHMYFISSIFSNVSILYVYVYTYVMYIYTYVFRFV